MLSVERITPSPVKYLKVYKARIMKRILFISAFLICTVSAFSQFFPGTDSLRSYNRKYITNNPATAFTNLRLNTLIAGIIDWIDTARAGTGGGGALGVDTIGVLNDSTLRYRDNGVWRNIVLKGVYDHRRKVDTIYSFDDTTIRFTMNGTVRTLLLHRWVDTAINVGSGEGVYKGRTGDSLTFKTLLGGYGINITSGTNELTVETDTAEVVTPTSLATAISIPSTLIPYGDASNNPTSSANLAYIEASNRLNTGTGSFTDSLLVGTMRTALLTENFPITLWDNTTKSLLQISHNSYIKNQFASKQAANAWYDSTKYHSGLIISSRGGGQASLYSPNLLWFLPQSNQSVFASPANGTNDFPILQLTTFNFNQTNSKIGAIMGFNYNTTGTSSKEFLITSSGFSGSNAVGGNIRIATGEVWNGSAFTGARKTGDFHVILDPCAAGEVQATKVLNAQTGVKYGDSTSSSTTVTITSAASFWFFSGSSTATWTLPAISGNRGLTFWIKNIGSADIVLTAGTNEIYSSATTTTFNITASQGYVVHNNGTYWIITTN